MVLKKAAISEEEYEILVKLVKWEFDTQVKERTRLQKTQLPNLGE